MKINDLQIGLDKFPVFSSITTTVLKTIHGSARDVILEAYSFWIIFESQFNQNIVPSGNLRSM